MTATWRPGRDRRAAHHPPEPARGHVAPSHGVVVVGGGIAGLAAATGLVERGVPVTLVEQHPSLGGRVRSWDVELPDGTATVMSRGFHAFFRQYYNLRALLRRVDPALARLRPVEDYPLQLADGPTDSFARIPRTPPWSIATFVARSPSFPLSALRWVDIDAALGLLDVDFPATYTHHDGMSAAELLDRLRFPDQARHLALEVFARSFFADPKEFSGGELLAMFHAYFTGSAEGLLFDVPDDDYDAALWSPLGAYLTSRGVRILSSTKVVRLDEEDDHLRVTVESADGEQSLAADSLVLATDRAGLQRLVADAGWLGDPAWRGRLAGLGTAPPFAVWRGWLDTAPRPGTPPFLGTSGFGPLDNVSFVDQLEASAASWASDTGGCVVELHAYALPSTAPLSPAETAGLKAELLRQLFRIHPELADATWLDEQWIVSDDCPMAGTDPWADRPGVVTPDPRVVLAGDGVRCDYPVALMERAATTGWLAANALLSRYGLPGHDLWSVPTRGRYPRTVRLLRRGLRALRRGGPRAQRTGPR